MMHWLYHFLGLVALTASLKADDEKKLFGAYPMPIEDCYHGG